MLTVLFYVLLGLAAAHFVYERILLPSVRLHYRNQLFELRDRVRDVMISNKSAADNQAATLVHDALNNAINRLHMMTLHNRYKAQRYMDANPNIRARIKKEIALFEKCNNQVINDTIRQSADILNKVLLFNSLMLIMYLLPIALVVFAVAKLIRTANSMLTVFRLVKSRSPLEDAVLLLPDQQVLKVVV
ncbi:hypothetical protein [Dickeya sp. ws52]|uniref:hypothetical protein n=1 Tax=Dickeya sp. ws52 TaxID=2576377 RepID=UPI00117CC425|nr:hypothetical protein [Dickeya sp. ws52]TYL43479.1 hypothetical protein FDP13_05880 [Dickeya sp. ws52]